MLSCHQTSIILDDTTGVGSFGIKISSTDYAMFVDATQSVGIGTMSLENKLAIRCASGDGIRLTEETSNGYGRLLIGSNGSLLMSSSNNSIVAQSNLNINTHDGVSNGLFLGGQLVKSSAQEINYSNALTPGIAMANKALVLNSSKDISDINSLSANALVASALTGVLQTASQLNISTVGPTLNIGSTSIATSNGTTTFTVSGAAPEFVFTGGRLSTSLPILATSGGTGIGSYSKGDILVATDSSTLSKLSTPASNNYMIQTDDSSARGVSWGMSNMTYYQYFESPKYLTSITYTFGQCLTMDSSYTYNIKINGTRSINLSTIGANGIDISSSPKTGTVYPDPTTTVLSGSNTLFTTELSVGNIISLTAVGSMGSITQAKKVASITSNTSLTVDSAFTLLNRWVLGATGTLTTTVGLIKFGTGAFDGANATTSNVTLTMGTPNLNFAGTLNAWTLEFFVRITTLSAQTICASTAANTFRLSMSVAGALTLFLGQGTTFNIANGSAITGNLTAGTYFHIAIVFTGSAYIVYRNGVAALTISSAVKLTASAFNSFIFGGSAASFNGQLDEIRISSIARYSTTFTPPTTAATVDSNTICLNKFNTTTSATISDISSGFVSYVKGGTLYANTVFYAYAISNINSSLSGYILSPDDTLPELPSGYSIYSSLPYFIPMNSGATPYVSIYNSNNYVCFGVPIPIVSAATNVAPTIRSTALDSFISKKATSIDLLVTHTHVGNTSCAITIGHNSLGLVRTVLTMASAGTQQLQITIPLTTTTIDTFLTAAASTTNYTIAIIGVQL